MTARKNECFLTALYLVVVFGRTTASTALLPLASSDEDESSSQPTSSMYRYPTCTKSTKQEQKRAANRKSAQMSRKRKKVFLEELRDENDVLRRKEQILKSIPDLVVVFDSSGKVWFASDSVGRFLDTPNSKLVGTCFWNTLSEDSTKRLKAAFMDSLAARRDDSEEEDHTTVPLGNGIWNDVHLVDADGTHKPVSLHGVVHFAGDRPECVCTIRPRNSCSTTDSSNSSTHSFGYNNNGHHYHHHHQSSNHTFNSKLPSTKQQRIHQMEQQQQDKATSAFVRISDSGQSSSTGEDSESGNDIQQVSSV
jgi:PAS domain-containing protein